MAVTAAPTRKEPGCVDVEQGKTMGRFWQAWNSISCGCVTNIGFGQSTGTTYSLLRTMFRLARAAVSMDRGSVRSCSTSAFNDWLMPRSVSTSVCITENCCCATWNLARVRMFTVTQTAKVASKIIPKTTHEGIIPPRRRTSVRLPMISIESCCMEAIEEFARRGNTRCDLMRSSTQ